MPEKEKRSGNTNIESGGDLNVGGNVVGGDSVTSTTTTTTTNIQEGGPVARYAVLGVVGIAALAIIIIALIAFRNSANTITPTAPPILITATPSPSATPLPPTDTPSPTATQTPSPTPTHELTATPTHTPQPGITPSPTSSVPVLDDFGDNCLDNTRWVLLEEQPGTATPIPSRGNCLDARRQFFAEDDGHLSVFLDEEATHLTEQTHAFVLTGACFRQVEVALALDQVQLLDAERQAYIFAGIRLERVSGEGDLDIWLQEGNTTGRDLAYVTSRLTLPDGYVKFGTVDYVPGTLVVVAFRVKGNKLTAYVNNEPIAGPFSILSDPCALSLGYSADSATILDGYFDEVRLQPVP